MGIDLHKKQYTAVIMDCFNEKLGEITFQNKPSEYGKLITKSKKYCIDGKQIVFALENFYGYGRALAVWLIEREHLVKDVNPALSYAYCFLPTASSGCLEPCRDPWLMKNNKGCVQIGGSKDG